MGFFWSRCMDTSNMGDFEMGRTGRVFSLVAFLAVAIVSVLGGATARANYLAAFPADGDYEPNLNFFTSTSGSPTVNVSNSAHWAGGLTPGAFSAGEILSMEKLNQQITQNDQSVTLNVDTDFTIGGIYHRNSGSPQNSHIVGSGTITFDMGANSTGAYSAPGVYEMPANPSFVVQRRLNVRVASLRASLRSGIHLVSDLHLHMADDRDEDISSTANDISGTGHLWMELGRSNDRWFSLRGTNTYSGGTTMVANAMSGWVGTSSGLQLRVRETGGLGTGDVTIHANQRNASVRFEADQVMASTASLFIQETAGNNVTLDVFDGFNTTVAGLWYNGVQQSDGIYTGGDFSWLAGLGTLTVASLTDPYLAVWDTDPVWSEEIAVMRNAGESYAGVYSYTDPGQHDPPNVVSIPDVGSLVPGGTIAQLWDGTASDATTAGMQWRARTAAEATMAGGGLVSDVMDLTGVAAPAGAAQGEVDPFVLAMSFTWEELEDVWGEGARSPYLVHFDDAQDEWIPAVDGNFGGTANYLGLMAYDTALHGLGDYGYSFDADENLYYAWAVLNHNGQFAVTAIPEPGAWMLLLAAAGCGLLARRRRRTALMG